MPINNFLVYGSLRPGQYNFNSFNSSYPMKHLGTVNIPGYKLYSLGAYPGAVYTGDDDDVLICDVISTDDKEVSQILDSMEINAGYHAVPMNVTINEKSVLVKLYEYTGEVFHLPLVASGDWTTHKQFVL